MPEVRLPLSPLLLAQEFVKDKPWQLLVVCILLNQTDGKRQVKPILADFFERWPDEEVFLRAPEGDVKKMIRSLGFQNIRYTRIRRMSVDWCQGKRPPEKLYGIGKYAEDSYKLFVKGEIVGNVEDKELTKYVQWASSQDNTLLSAVTQDHP
jgi:adenine-specific DNA glycosylase